MSSRMSLASASSIIGGVKEYTFRGIQQLPIVLATTSLVFTIASGSVVHATLAGGLMTIIPLYTFMLQTVLQAVLSRSLHANNSWKRSKDDSCSIIKERLSLDSLTSPMASTSVPSYWLTSIGFFIGYAISNAVDSLTIPSQPTADPSNIEKRKTQAVYVIVASCVFFAALLFVRFRVSSSCEGFGGLGWVLSILSAGGAAAIGFGAYSFSRKCGSRTSDLFGILSQILPTSSTAPNPVVCMAS